MDDDPDNAPLVIVYVICGFSGFLVGLVCGAVFL